MINKKLIIVPLLFVTPILNASTLEPFPSTDRGIKYVEQSELNIPPAFKQEMIASQNAMQKQGYIEKDNSYINELMSMRKNALREIRDSKKIANPYDTHLKGRLSDIKLSFGYKGIPNLDKKNIIGYAPAGGYKKDNGKPEGWTGIATFFETKELGSCEYSFNHILAIQLVKDTVKFLVNNKPTNTMVEGVPHNGFLYDVTWYTDTTMSSLRCANKKFDLTIKNKMIELARKIDAKQAGTALHH